MAEPLGDLQLQVMDIVWRLGSTTVAQAHEAMSESRKLAYTTVLTTLRGLERRGMVQHEQVGKAYVYEAVVSREQYAEASVGKLVADLFDGRAEGLLCHLLGAEKVTESDLADIRRMVATKQGRRGQ